MRVVRLIIFSYGGCNIIGMIVKIGTIFIINIDIKDKLVIIIPLGVILILNTPRRSYRDYNGGIESDRGDKRDNRINRK